MKTLTFEALVVFCLAAAVTGCAQTPPERSATGMEMAPQAPSAVPLTAPVAAPDTGVALTNVPAAVRVAPALQDVLRLLRAGVEESVLLTHIGQSQEPFGIVTEEILYLTDLGASGEVINAMMERDRELTASLAPASAPGAAPNDLTAAPVPSGVPADAALEGPPAEAVTVDYFYDYMTPYGAWVDIPGYGRCWQPTVVVNTPGWMPYGDRGRWLYTDYGWYWYSDYTWGWAAFHYGRWLHHSTYGWCWTPGSVWGPSWVTWRYTDDYAGWAPLPPTSYSSISIGVGWSVPHYCYTYVPVHQVCHPQPRHCAVPYARSEHIHKQAKVCNRYEVARDHTIVNRGIDPNQLGRSGDQLTRARVLREENPTRPSRRGETFDAQQSVVRTFGPQTTKGRDSIRTTEMRGPSGQEPPSRQIPSVTRPLTEEPRDNALVIRGSSPSRNAPSTQAASRERPELRERGSYFSATAPRGSVTSTRSAPDGTPSATTVRSGSAGTTSPTAATSPSRNVPGSVRTEVGQSTVPRVTGSAPVRVPLRPEATPPTTASREVTGQRTTSATPDLSRRSTTPPELSRSTSTRSGSSLPATRSPSVRSPFQDQPRFTTPSRTVPSMAPTRSAPTRPSIAPAPERPSPVAPVQRSFEPPAQRSREAPRIAAPAAPTRQVPSAAPSSPAPSNPSAAPPGRGAPSSRGGRD